jgi:hypothetical protein
VSPERTILSRRQVLTQADRLLAETVQVLEAGGATVGDATEAERQATVLGGDLEQRIVNRAALVSAAGDLREALVQVRRSLAWLLAAGGALALLAGSAAASAALGLDRSQPVNVFWLLGGVLGVQTMLLIAWVLVLCLMSRSLAAASLGGVLVTLAGRLAARINHGRALAAAVTAFIDLHARGPVGRWTVSAISHGLWTAFNMAAITVLIAMLSTRQYTFAWETTILSSSSYAGLTHLIGTVPRLVGFQVPTQAQIAGSERDLDPAAAEASRAAWAAFIIGSVVCYGLAPRLLLLAVCLGLRRRALRVYRLDLNRPGYVMLRARLMPEAVNLGVVDAAQTRSGSNAPAIAGPGAPDGAISLDGGSRINAAGPSAAAALEYEPPRQGWPPTVPGLRWMDLGRIDDSADRQRALRELAAASPSLLLIACAATTTPDRGIGAALSQLRAAAPRLVLLLSAGHVLRGRTGAAGVAQRIDDWRALAARAGVASTDVIELDLEHATEASLQRLAAMIGGPAAPPRGSEHLEEAFDLVARAAASWAGPPDVARRAELHRQIARLYQRASGDWSRHFRMPTDGRAAAAQAAEAVAASARRVTDLLPMRLRLQPRWLAAGAAAGAIGCAASAALVFPAAITSLPFWAALGAAIAALLPPPAGEAATGSVEAGRDHAAAVRAAAVWAVVLALQGHDEAAISRVMEHAFGEDAIDAAVAADPARWLGEVRHRFETALVRERARG